MAVREVPVSGHLAGTGAQELRNLQFWQSAGTPAAATAEGVFWYDTNSGNKRIYFRDNAGAVPVPRLDRAETVTGQWTISPGSTQPPFVLGANAQGQKVVGLNADQLDGRDSNTNPTANTIALRDSNGRLTAEDPVGLTDLVNLQYLNDALSFLTISATQVTTGVLALARGGTNADLSAAATGGLIYKGASALAATAALTGVLIGNGASAPSALSQLTVALGGTGGATAAAARANLGVPWTDEVQSLAAGRSYRGGVLAGQGTICTGASSTGFAAGTRDFTVSMVLQLMDWTPLATATLYVSHSLGNNRFTITLGTNGAFSLNITNGSGSVTTYTLTPDVALADGGVYRITVSVDRDGNATLYVNALSDRDASGAGVAADVSGSSTVDIGSGNTNGFAVGSALYGIVSELLLYNFALTAADVAQLSAQGSVSAGDQWASGAASYTSDFSAGLDSWTTDLNGSARLLTGNTDGIGGEDNWLKVETAVTTTAYCYRSAALTQSVPGGHCRVTARVFVPTGSPITHVAAFQTGAVAGSYAAANKVVKTVTPGAIVTLEGVYVANGSGGLVFMPTDSNGNNVSVAAGNPYYLKDITFETVGCRQALDFENTAHAYTTMVRDRSSNAVNATLTGSAVSTKIARQINAGFLLANNLTANTVVYAGAGGLLTSVTANASATRQFLSQVSSGTPGFFDLFGGANTWTGAQTFSGAVSVPTPTLSTHAATMGYVDSVAASGLRPLVGGPCALATTGNITLSGEQTIDGVMTSSTRVLVKNQTTAAQNGPYVTSSGAWTRVSDCDSAAEISVGAYTYVTGGATNAGTSWRQANTVTTLGTDPVAWVQFFQQAAYAAGAGISITGLSLAIDQGAALNWTGVHTFTNSGGVKLQPHGAAAGNTTALRFHELAANGTNFVALKAPDNIAADVTWTLPAADGSGYAVYLKTNAAGVLSFGSVSSAEISNAHFVTSVSGTTNRISVGGSGLDPVIDIAATYAGQTSITTLGTITTGVWSGTAIGVTKGGTGLTAFASGDLVYASGTNTLAARAIGSAGTFLQSLSGAPNWSGYAMPTTVGANQLLYGSSSSAVSALAAVANRVLTTDGSGVLAWRNTLPAGLSVEGDTDSKIVKMKWFNVGNGTDSNITLTHNFGTYDVLVKLYENSGADGYRDYPLVPVSRPSIHTVQLEFITVPTSGQFRACVEAAL